MSLTRLNKQIKILNGNLIQNDSGRFTAYFEEFPEIIAEGNNEEDARVNLISALQEVLEYKKRKASVALGLLKTQKPNHPVKHFDLMIA